MQNARPPKNRADEVLRLFPESNQLRPGQIPSESPRRMRTRTLRNLNISILGFCYSSLLMRTSEVLL